MAGSVAINEPQLPWVDHGEDRGFKWLMISLLLLFLGTGVVLNLITLPEIEQRNLVDVSPRLAKLILEKQKVKPPPPKPEPKKEEKKKEPEKKKEEPKKEEPKKPEPKKEVKKESARDVAKKSGLIALSDELADLRESFDLDSVAALPQTDAGKQAVVVASSSDLLTSSSTAKQSSGGIQTNTLSRKLETSELAQRQTAKVESKIESQQQLAKASQPKQSGTGSGGSAGRTSDEVERVFQQYRGKIDSLYNRALRQNPMLQGKVVLELTVAPNGQVTDVRIVSSELGDEELERKLLLSVRKFKFPSSSAARTTITYPIDFLPS